MKLTDHTTVRHGRAEDAPRIDRLVWSYNDARTRRWHRLTGRQQRWDAEAQRWVRA